MRYKENSEPYYQELSNLKPGDVFKSNAVNGMYYLLTELVTDDIEQYGQECRVKSWRYRTAINLSTGEVHSFSPSYRVVLVENA